MVAINQKINMAPFSLYEAPIHQL